MPPSSQGSLQRETAAEERSDFLMALDSVLVERGVRDLTTSTPTPERPGDWKYGASLRLRLGEEAVQDLALFGEEETVAGFVRWLFDFDDDMELPGPALLDALGETLNQLAGNLKDIALAQRRVVATLDTPTMLGEASARMYISTHTESTATLLTSADWPGALLLLASAPMTPVLHAVHQARAVFEKFGDTTEGLVRAQRILHEIAEHPETLQTLPGMRTTLEWCDSGLSTLINEPDAEDESGRRAQIDRELRQLRRCLAKLSAPRAETDFSVRDDEELSDLLGVFCEEALDILDSLVKALNVPGPELIDVLFRGMHTLKGNAGFFGLVQVQRLAHATEDMLGAARDEKRPLFEVELQTTKRSISLVQHWLALLADAIESGLVVAFQPEVEDHRRMIEHAMIAGDPLVVPTQGEADADAQAGSGRDALRVGKDVIERLVVCQSELSEIIRQATVDESTTVAALVAELTVAADTLKGVCQSIHRVALDQLFGKVARLCRETAERIGKHVKIKLVGERLQVPRHLVTALSGPMVHLARNAVDHGIETPEERTADGKDLLATIEFRATYEDRWLTIEVIDDGRGIVAEKILAKAVRLGLAEPDAQLSNADILDLLMSAGFSTAEKTTDISGRGVGMDVVRKDVELVGGHIELTTTPGHGSVFTILLPEEPGLLAPGADTAAAPEDEAVEEAEAGDLIELSDDGELTFL